MSVTPFSIEETFVVMSPDKQATPETFDALLYHRIDRTYDGFKGHELIACHQFERDWPTWEIHPHGDEVIVLMSGRATLLLETDAGEDAIELSKAGDVAIVPKDTWHTARISVPTQMLFITPGEDTQNRDA